MERNYVCVHQQRFICYCWWLSEYMLWVLLEVELSDFFQRVNLMLFFCSVGWKERNNCGRFIEGMRRKDFNM